MDRSEFCSELEEVMNRSFEDLKDLLFFSSFTHFAYITSKKNFEEQDADSVYSFSFDFAPDLEIDKMFLFRKEIIPLWENYDANMLDNHIFPNLLNRFEYCYFDLIRLILTHNPKHISEKKQIEVGKIIEANCFEEIIDYIINNEIHELSYKPLEDWFDYLESLINIDLPSEDDIKLLSEAKACRDILVHNSGIVNDMYIKKSGSKSQFELGEDVVISQDYFQSTWVLVNKILKDIFEGISDRMC
jgi:hypothetical protein